MKNGHVPDDGFKELGFPRDKTINGENVRREVTINMESRQQAKVLTHTHQVKLREKRLSILQAEA